MRESLASPNDRLRTVAYSFFEHNPDPAMIAAAARRARQGAGRVRPSGAGARAGGARRRSARPAGADARERRAAKTSSAARSSRRSATTRPRYAFDALTAIAKLDGPLQDDAAIALGKIGDKRALETLAGLQRTAPRARSRRSPPPSACSASTASRTRTISSRRSKFADENAGFQELLRGAAAGLGALGVAGRADGRRGAVRRRHSVARSDARAGRAGAWRRSRCATRR